ncbi:MAG: right-handed parallel beta-helix repeat-containing protein [Candidatus Bipolaricaulota bacterium]
MNTHNLSTILFPLIIGIILVTNSVAAGDTHTVCKTCQLDSIQQAIEQARDGDVISIESGTYHEEITLDQSLILVGEGPDAVTLKGGNNGRPVLYIGPSAIDAQVGGLTIQEAGGATCQEFSRGMCPNGITVAGRAKVELSSLRVRDNSGDGILLTSFAQATLQDCRISQNADGIVLKGGSSAAIKNSTVSNHIVNVLVRGSSRVSLQDNFIYGAFIYGVAASVAECGFRDAQQTFTGQISGGRNRFTDNGELHWCPQKLSFLKTEDGGSFTSE